MATEEYRLASERTEKGLEHRYGGLTKEQIDKIYGVHREEIEATREQLFKTNPKIRFIVTEVRIK